MSELLKYFPICGGEAKRYYCAADGTCTSNVRGGIAHGKPINHNLIMCTKCGLRTKVYATDRCCVSWNRRANEKDN